MSLVSVNLTLSTLWSNRVKTFDVKYAACGGSFVDYGTSVK